MRNGEIHELVRELKRYAIKYEFDNWHIRLFGGNEAARNHYENLIASDENIEAMLILELSKTDAELRYVIEERASIMWDCGKCPYDILYATKTEMRVARKNEAEGQL